MKGVTILHAAENGLSFEAKVSRRGRTVAIIFKDGESSKILVARDEVIDMAMPSVDGKFMFLQLTNGAQRLYATQTGKQLERKRGFNPQFYS
ncbi:MAG: hypothetical protein Q8O59_01950 [bacterium]|nr:hypothetical protein [bacterium]